MGTLSPGWRPARLPAWLGTLSGCLLGLSFLSGLLLWWSDPSQDPLSPSPTPGGFSFHFWLQLHGWLNPLLCTWFGYLLCHHARVGWQRRLNRLSGLLMILCLCGLIVSGAGLYYAGQEEWRAFWNWTHRGCGLFLPVALLVHGWCGLRLGRRANRPDELPLP